MGEDFPPLDSKVEADIRREVEQVRRDNAPAFFQVRKSKYRPRSAGRRLREWLQRKAKRKQKMLENVEATCYRLGMPYVPPKENQEIVLQQRLDGKVQYSAGRWENELRTVWLTPERAMLCKRSGKVYVERVVHYVTE